MILRTALLTLAIVIAASAAAAAEPSRQAEPGHHLYVNTDYGFSLEIPDGMTAEPFSGPWSMESMMGYGGRTGTPVVSVTVFSVNHGGVATGQPYPLFFYAWARVGVSSDTADCYQPVPAPRGPSTGTPTVVNGVRFLAFQVGDAGMMKYMRAVSYRTIHDGRCYAVEQIERGSDYRDSSMKPGLTRDELDAYYNEAGTIARSFRFLESRPGSGAK